MGVIDTVRETVSLIQQVDNIEILRKMLALQTQVVELFEENRALKEKLTVRDSLEFRDNTYWRGSDGPFCSPCWDGKSLLVRLHSFKSGNVHCPVCKSMPTPKNPVIA